MRRLTQEEFIAKSIAKYGDKYDYSKVNYRCNGQKVAIVCKLHGVFEQAPNSHLLGKGCPKCGRISVERANAFTKDDFVRISSSKHNDKYDYSLVEYSNARKKVKIICPKHGVFEQEAYSHMHGCGCPKCKNREQTTKDFIERARMVHGDKYDYYNAIYTNNHTNLCITCKEHGDFVMTPTNHIHGKQGCPKCATERNGIRCRLTTQEFIEKSNMVHNNRYDYSQTRYVTQKERVKIICKKHGAFFQLPSNHLKGEGCPKCNKSRGESFIEQYLRKNNINHITQYRIPNEDLFCQNKKLVVDFYLPQRNIFIEFNGVQHYRPSHFFGGKHMFDLQQNRDDALRVYCKEHGITLIEIPYTVSKNLEQVLDKALKKGRK